MGKINYINAGINDYTRVFTDALVAEYLNPDHIGNFTQMTPSLVDVSILFWRTGIWNDFN
jgi:hypothetical protein